MTQEEFLALWLAQKHAYIAWGRFVKEEVERQLLAANASLDLKSFIKIPPEPRVKEQGSLLDKAFSRGKPYTDPFKEIEDKVGLRFVVLLTTDILQLQSAVVASAAWTASLDKDFEKERNDRPLEFVYQSKHYVVKASENFEFQGTMVPKGTPCEIQLRTLLQHAHSELTHDNIYKRKTGSEVGNKVVRTVAKSMALIEAVDDFFAVAIRELNELSKVERDALEILSYQYRTFVGVAPSADKSNMVVLGAFRDRLDGNLMERLGVFIQNNPFVIEKIQQRMAAQSMYRQAWILLLYMLVKEFPNRTASDWPFIIDDIRAIYIDLGKVPPQ